MNFAPRASIVFGPRRRLVIGLIVFTLASLVAAVATGTACSLPPAPLKAQELPGSPPPRSRRLGRNWRCGFRRLLAGHLVGKLGGRRVAPVSLLVAATGLGFMVIGGSDMMAITGATVASFGLGAGFLCASVAALSDVDPAESGAAPGALSSFHELGSGVGVAAVAVIGATVAAIVLPRGVPTDGAAHFTH